MKKFSIQEAIEKRRIILFPDGHKVSSKELRIAKEDLQDAKETLARERFKVQEGAFKLQKKLLN